MNRAVGHCPTWSSWARDNAATIYIYPAEADYVDRRPLDPSWTRVDSSIRETDEDYGLPTAMADRPAGSALIYLSLGSLGAAERRADATAGRRPRNHPAPLHRQLWAPQADKITLAGNMVGEQMLPQTKIIPLVDAVISHGGDNTTTEALHFGKPLIVLPLFWDQVRKRPAHRRIEAGHTVGHLPFRRCRIDRRRRRRYWPTTESARPGVRDRYGRAQTRWPQHRRGRHRTHRAWPHLSSAAADPCSLRRQLIPPTAWRSTMTTPW